MKKLLFLTVVLGLAACKEKDLSTENPAPSKDNLKVSVSYLYGGEAFKKDSLYTNNKNNSFYITEIKFMISDFFIENKGDTIEAENKYFTYSLDEKDHGIMKIPAGGYSGAYGFRLGMDSVQVFMAEENGIPQGSGLLDNDIIRNQGLGYNSLVIKGRLLDPKDLLDTIGNIPFEYLIGGVELFKDLKSQQLNFNISNSTTANFVLNVDPEPVLNDFDIFKTPTLISDPTDKVNYNKAVEMRDSIKISLF